jgi:CO dehydrogenase maturation factor
MILGFLGKGGSGKSSVSTQMTLWLKEKGRNVLAIDADHNMDLSFNVTSGTLPSDMPYLGNSLDELQACVDLTPDEKYSEAFLRGSKTRFSFSDSEIDAFTEKYTRLITPRLRLMTAGPQTEQVLFGQSCSHILTTPLKIYLPFLKLADLDEVVVDEKAGADGVTTGIVTGIDVAIIVCEPALHSVKTAAQIAELLTWYDTPYIIVGNKIASDEDKEFIELNLPQKPTAYLTQSNDMRRSPSEVNKEWSENRKLLYQKAKSLNKNDRIERTTKKFERNSEFAEST